jgi:hypothetical protein
MNLTQSLRVGIIAGLIMIAFCISCSGIESEDAGHLQVEFSPNYSLDANMGELYSSEIPLTNLSLQLESLETDIFNDPRSTSDWVRCLGDYESRLRERAVRLAHIEAQLREEWPELNDDERIKKTRILEDLLRRQAVHLYDFQYHLKKRYCHLTFSDQMEFLHSFEDLLDRESLLLEGFEGFLHQLQNVQDQYQIEFLASFEDLIRRQAILLDIYEDLLKTRCNELRLYKYVVRCGEFRCGQNITYNYVLSNICNCTFEGVRIIDDRLGVVVEGVSLRPYEKKVFSKSTILNYTSGTTVCNTASAIGVDSDGFTIFSPSNEVCITIAEPLLNHNLDLINLGSQKTIAFASNSAIAENSILIKKNQDGRSSSNNDTVNRDAIRVGDQLAGAHQNSKASNSIKIVSNQG